MRRVVALWIWLAAALASPADAAWMRAESPNFIVYSEGSESRLRDRIAKLEEYDALLRLMIGAATPPSPNKLHVYIVRGHDDLEQIHDVADDIAGFYTATPHGIAAFVDGSVEAGENEVLFHEYAHHFMMQYAGGAYPAWYVEGFAEYFATAEFRPRQIDIGRFSEGRIYSIVNGSWLPIDRILSGNPGGLGREQMGSYYALSWLMTHYYYSGPERQASLRSYLAAAARSNDAVGALEAATGMTPEQLREELRRYIRGGTISYRRMARDAAPPAPATNVVRLPESAEDLMVHAAALHVGLREEDAAARLARIRTVAARHPADPFARRVLAHAEAVHGDAAAADRLLDALLVEAPQDAELLYLKGMRHLRAAEEGDWETEARTARTWFTRAHRADDNHFQTLYHYAMSLRGEPNYVSENTSNVLLLAHNLAPQVADIRMNAAVMLMNRRAFGEAVALLRPVAGDPHNSGLAQAAQRLIAEARTQEAQAGPEPAEAVPPEPAAGAGAE